MTNALRFEATAATPYNYLLLNDPGTSLIGIPHLYWNPFTSEEENYLPEEERLMLREVRGKLTDFYQGKAHDVCHSNYPAGLLLTRNERTRIRLLQTLQALRETIEWILETACSVWQLEKNPLY